MMLVGWPSKNKKSRAVSYDRQSLSVSGSADQIINLARPGEWQLDVLSLIFPASTGA